MRAGDLAIPRPAVGGDTAAAWLLAGRNRPNLIGIDDAGRASTVLPGTRVPRTAAPLDIQDVPAQARVVEEAAADMFPDDAAARTMAQAVVTGDGPLLGAVSLDVLLDRLVG